MVPVVWYMVMRMSPLNDWCWIICNSQFPLCMCDNARNVTTLHLPHYRAPLAHIGAAV